MARKPKLRLRMNGKLTPPEHDRREDLDEEPAIQEGERTRRLRSNPRRPSTIIHSLLSNPRRPTTSNRRLVSNPRTPNSHELLRPYYEWSFPGWVTSTLPRNLQARHLLQEALIPSPLIDDDWTSMESERKAAWTDVVDHTSSGIRTLYYSIRENLSDVEQYIFGGEKEFPSKCQSGWICDLTEQGSSAADQSFVDSDASDNHPLSMLRMRLVGGDYVLPLDPKAGSGRLQRAAEGKPLSGAKSSLELRRLSLMDEDRHGFFVVNGTLAPLFVNGLSVGMNMVAGPLPDFAVVEAEDAVFFWWCTIKGVNSIPKHLPTVDKTGSEPGSSKRSLVAVEGYENLNDEAPSAKRPKLDDGHQLGTPNPSCGAPVKEERASDAPPDKEVGTDAQAAPTVSRISPQPNGSQREAQSKRSRLLPPNWKSEYRRRIEECNAQGSQKDRKKGTPWAAHKLTHTKFLFEDDVFLPIAAVWYGLVKENVNFAFGSRLLFELARSGQHHGMACVLSPHIFIMPLISNAEMSDPTGEEFERPETQHTKPTDRNKSAEKQKFNKNIKPSSGAGATSNDGLKTSRVDQQRRSNLQAVRGRHCLLVIAERTNSSGEGESIRLVFMDSRPDSKNGDRFRHAARNLVRNSQWLQKMPISTNECWSTVAQQGSGNSTDVASGIHVVLNAWAYMLRIPLAQNPRLNNDFYVEARKVISLALKGCLDSGTIRAFMQAYEYAAYEDLTAVRHSEEKGQTTPDGLRYMQSVYMNEYIFDEIMDRMQREERGKAAYYDDGASPQGGERPSGRGENPRGGDSSAPVIDPPRGDSSAPTRNPMINPQPPGEGLLPPGRDSSDPGQGSSGSRKDSPSPQSWETILKDGLQRHCEYYKGQTVEFQKNCARIDSSVDMEDQPVVLAIASLWEGLRRAGIVFSFATADTFRGNRSADTVMFGNTAVFVSRPLIMPLLMNWADVKTPSPPPKSTQDGWGKVNSKYEDTRGKNMTKSKGKGKAAVRNTHHLGGVGHFVLAVAERFDNNQIQIIVMDSSPGHVGNDHVLKAARGLVTYSGWMGIDGHGNQLSVTPNFAAEDYRKVPTQHLGNTCGLYVILNAWAYMLGIPLRKDRLRSHNYPHVRFHQTGLGIINLALAGFMDSSTIQAFLLVWGYAMEQDVNDPSVHVERADAVRMDQQTLQNLVIEQRFLERVSAGASPPTEGQIITLTDLGFSRDNVIEQLIRAGGCVDAAADRLYQLQNSTSTETRAKSGPGVSFSAPEGHIEHSTASENFPRDSVIKELVKSRENRSDALNGLCDQRKTASPPTTANNPPLLEQGNETSPPGTGLDHPYDEEDIARLISYRDNSVEIVFREIERAGGNIAKAEEKIRHLSLSLSSSPGSSHSYSHRYSDRRADPGPMNQEFRRTHADADVDWLVEEMNCSDEQLERELAKYSWDVDRTVQGMMGRLKGSVVARDVEGSKLYESPEHAKTNSDREPGVDTDQSYVSTAHPPALQRERVFPEEDVAALTSIGHSRAQATFALSVSYGDLAGAMDYLRRESRR